MSNLKYKHWRDVYKSDHLASWDLDKNAIVTIKHCIEEECKLAKGKEKKVVAYFLETELPNGVKLKPMILNPTNCKFLQSKTGNQFFSQWNNLNVEIAVIENKGGIGEKFGLRFVNVFTEIDWTEIQELYNLKQESLTGDEQIRAEKIISTKDAKSHQKMLDYLKSK
jgi:hypothetical protein